MFALTSGEVGGGEEERNAQKIRQQNKEERDARATKSREGYDDAVKALLQPSHINSASFDAKICCEASFDCQ